MSLLKQNRFFFKIFIIVIFIIVQNFFYGFNDYASLAFLLFISLMIYLTIYKLHITSRHILRNYTKEKSKLYNFLSGRSFISMAVAIFISLFSSIMLLTCFKAIAISHGFLSICVIILIGSFFIEYSKKMFIFNSAIHNNISENIVISVNKFMVLFYLVFIFNFIFSLILSYFDYQIFINNNVTLNNFEKFAQSRRILQNDNNKVSFILINSYLLIDSFKMAFTNLLYEIINIDKSDYAILSFLFIFFLNFIKFLGFSFAFVYFQNSISEQLDKIFKSLQERKTNEN